MPYLSRFGLLKVQDSLNCLEELKYGILIAESRKKIKNKNEVSKLV